MQRYMRKGQRERFVVLPAYYVVGTIKSAGPTSLPVLRHRRQRLLYLVLNVKPTCSVVQSRHSSRNTGRVFPVDAPSSHLSSRCWVFFVGHRSRGCRLCLGLVLSSLNKCGTTVCNYFLDPC